MEVWTAFRNLWIVSCGSEDACARRSGDGKICRFGRGGFRSAPYAVASSPDSVWMLTDDKTTLTRIDPDTNSIVSEMRLPADCRSIMYADVRCGPLARGKSESSESTRRPI